MRRSARPNPCRDVSNVSTLEMSALGPDCVKTSLNDMILL